MRLLTINTGSSSLKSALYRVDHREQVELSAEATRIGVAGSHLSITDAGGKALLDQEISLPDHAAALHAFLDYLGTHHSISRVDAVGHRIVHGGPTYSTPVRITEGVGDTLRSLIPIDPMHLPQAISAIDAVSHTFSGVPQVACFDTGFHRHMPRVAQMYALPQQLERLGVVRYGFHGLSYEYIMQELGKLDGAAAGGRVIIAHLGNGASMAAVQAGIGIDTTMGFTPNGGLVMGTRSGDLDPGVLLYLLEAQHMSAGDLTALVTRKAGLLGVSGSSADMHDLLDREAGDEHAAEAVAIFCYQAKKFLGALVAALGGVDTLVFTGGIGEHAAPVRERICAGLGFLKLHLDARRNAEHAPIISSKSSAVQVRVMQTNEDLMIAQHTYRLITEEG